MCLAVPVQIEALVDEQTATANLGGIRKNINIALVDDLQVGDYVILHVGVALKKLDQEEAEKTLALFGELEALESTRSQEKTL